MSGPDMIAHCHYCNSAYTFRHEYMTIAEIEKECAENMWCSCQWLFPKKSKPVTRKTPRSRKMATFSDLFEKGMVKK